MASTTIGGAGIDGVTVIDATADSVTLDDLDTHVVGGGRGCVRPMEINFGCRWPRLLPARQCFCCKSCYDNEVARTKRKTDMILLKRRFLTEADNDTGAYDTQLCKSRVERDTKDYIMSLHVYVETRTER